MRPERSPVPGAFLSTDVHNPLACIFSIILIYCTRCKRGQWTEPGRPETVVSWLHSYTAAPQPSPVRLLRGRVSITFCHVNREFGSIIYSLMARTAPIGNDIATRNLGSSSLGIAAGSPLVYSAGSA